ncbi:MAG: cobamide remodeling phosphodiesterase CbiR [Thermodesulfobacteriota bacterium]
MSAFQNTKSPWHIAAPSFVWPAVVGDNCYYLQHLVDEVEIIFFETESSLNYTEHDLPPDLKDLGLGFHLHLPLDLPWEEGVERVIQDIEKLAAQVEYLSPHCFVLHPPPDPQLFTQFHRAWENHPYLNTRKLLLENVQENDLIQAWPLILQTDFRICLDLGHMLAFGQQEIFNLDGFWERLEMLHIYGDNDPSRHTSLANLSSAGQEILGHVLQTFPSNKTIVLEVFNPEELNQSLDILSKWIINWGLS